MRNILCERCGTPLAAGHQPENHACTRCRHRLPADRHIACPHCTAVNAITWHGDPAEVGCGACGYALGHVPPPPPAKKGDAGAAVGLVGGAALGARLGGLPGALLGGLFGLLVGNEQGNSPPPQTPEDQALRLSAWIRAWYPYREPLTHQRLQALAFYCHGIALAHGVGKPFGLLRFEPWASGPVCRPIWNHFRHLGNGSLPPLTDKPPTLPPEVAGLLVDVLTVYGALDAWRLQQQGKSEQPYAQAWGARQACIDADVTRRYFEHIYRPGSVDPPAWLFDGGSFAVDGIPRQRYHDLAALAGALRG
ncbi:MAG: hypothetical protein H6706_00095 [Myxococcales bacterium]|nr:hypothetical protein [Myxococcales bacterium]